MSEWEEVPLTLDAFRVEHTFLGYDPETGDWYACAAFPGMTPYQIPAENVVRLYEWLKERMT